MTGSFAVLNKIYKKCDTAPLKVKCDWVADEFSVLIVDGKAAWRGKYSKKDIETLCDGIGIPVDDYIEECRDAFTNTVENGKFSFAIENNTFIWKKKIDTDLTVKFGGIKLSSVPLIETLEALLDFSLQLMECYKKEALDAKNKQHYFEEVHSNLVAKLRKYEEEKREMENSLYCRFLCLLNTKKERIKHLEQELLGLSSKMQNNVGEKQETEDNDKVELQRKDQVNGKKVRQPRKRNNNNNNNNIVLSSVQTSTVTNLEFHDMSQNPGEYNGVSTSHSKGKELLIPKRNISKKGQRNNQASSNVENSNSINKKEENELVNEKSSSVPELCPDKFTVQAEITEPIAGPSFISSSTETEHSKSEQQAKIITTIDRNVLSEHSKYPHLEISPDKVSEHLEKETSGVHTTSQNESNFLSKVSDVICPIDLVSEKLNRQSGVSQNLKSIKSSSDEKKRAHLSPRKQRKDFDIISPLDLLNSKSYSPPPKRLAVSSETVNMPRKNCLNNPVVTTNTHDYTVGEFSKNMNIESEPYLGNLHDTTTLCEDPVNAKTNTDSMQEPLYGIKLIESKSDMEVNHYDSETDVDEPEESSSSTNSTELTGNKEESSHITKSSALGNILQSVNTCPQNSINNSEKCLNDSPDSDNFSMEPIEPALPKRMLRSNRAKKCVPVDKKSINHFTKLGQLRDQNENTSHEVQAPIYDQDTQIADTQKLLDEL